MLQPLFTLKVKITFLTPVLGSAPRGDVYASWIATKAPAGVDTADEIASAPDVEKGVTGFHRFKDGSPFLYGYVLSGFFKQACSFLRREPHWRSSKITSHKVLIDGMIFPAPRMMPLLLPEGWTPEDWDPAESIIGGGAYSLKNGTPTVTHTDTYPAGMLSRPLRASTAQGERVALVVSEVLPAGTHFFAEIACLGKLQKEDLVEWLDFGAYNGIGQWRNAQWGQFTWEEIA